MLWQKHAPPPPFRRFFPTRSSAARLAILFIRACDAALLRSPSAAFRLLRSLMRSMTEACSARTRVTHADGSAARSSSSLRSSAARSSSAFSFSRRARARASNPALRSFCFFFSFKLSSSSYTNQSSDHVTGLSGEHT